MAINFEEVNQLEKTRVQPGEKWIYVADFNIKHKGTELKSTDRIDTEIKDIRQIAESGGITLILAHKGRYKDGDTEELDFIVPELSRKLGRPVRYFPKNNTYGAAAFIGTLHPGDVAILGNTRKNPGEEKNDPALAEQYAMLGEKVAVGGFGKAHRKEASNAGILEYLPGYATRSQLEEMIMLAPWAGKSEKYSVAVLGGAKKEKITEGLKGFSQTYDIIIPGGIVLNTILKVKGYDIGDSLIEDSGKTFEKEAEAILKTSTAEIACPTMLVIARTTDNTDKRIIYLPKSIPKGYRIVDFVLPHPARQALSLAERIILAGTPGIYTGGFDCATRPILEAMKKPGILAAVLGGDTAAEAKFEGPTSTGGGSALYFAAYGTTPVFEALKENKKRYS